MELKKLKNTVEEHFTTMEERFDTIEERFDTIEVCYWHNCGGREDKRFHRLDLTPIVINIKQVKKR